MENVKNLIKLLKNSGAVFRFSQTDLVRPDTLLTHISISSIVAAFIMDHIREEYGTDLLTDSEYAEVLRRLIIHDLEETVLGDIIHTTKYADDALLAAVKRLEQKTMEGMVNDYNFPKCWMDSWADAKGNSVGAIVKFADLFSAFFIMYRERVFFRNQHIENKMLLSMKEQIRGSIHKLMEHNNKYKIVLLEYYKNIQILLEEELEEKE